MRKFNSELKEADIRKKLHQSGIKKDSEYKNIIANLQKQKQRLEDDLLNLRIKVKALEEKQKRKIADEKTRAYDPENQYAKLKDQLDRKYNELG